MGRGERVAETACVRENRASHGNDASSPLTSQGDTQNLRVCSARIRSSISVYFRIHEPHKSGILVFVEKLRSISLAGGMNRKEKQRMTVLDPATN